MGVNSICQSAVFSFLYSANIFLIFFAHVVVYLFHFDVVLFTNPPALVVLQLYAQFAVVDYLQLNKLWLLNI